jgi:formylglycine-generating enzyme required for sulfatase activity
MVCVDWQEAARYCAWVGGRLPTESEWEYAARGPQSLLYPWGNQFDGTRLNYCDEGCPYAWRDTAYADGYATVAPAVSYEPGAGWTGALNLAGNVWEWTSSLYEPYPRHDDAPTSQPDARAMIVIRGGSWATLRSSGRAAHRYKDYPSYTTNNLGFRCVIPSP